MKIPVFALGSIDLWYWGHVSQACWVLQVLYNDHVGLSLLVWGEAASQ
jgi:hypothetical protein